VSTAVHDVQAGVGDAAGADACTKVPFPGVVMETTRNATGRKPIASACNLKRWHEQRLRPTPEELYQINTIRQAVYALAQRIGDSRPEFRTFAIPTLPTRPRLCGPSLLRAW
jgi:hypothetical protein